LELWKPLLTLARFFDCITPQTSGLSGVSGRLLTDPPISQKPPTDSIPTVLDSKSKKVSSNISGVSQRDAARGGVVNRGLQSPPSPPIQTQGSVSTPSLCSLMLDMACTLAKRRHTENMTEVGDDVLVQCLQSLVKPTQLFQWVTVRALKQEMCSQFEENQEWLTSHWVGIALRRLGFSDKRRVGGLYEYNIPYSAVIDLKKRMQVDDPETDESLQKTLETSRQWISEHKDADGSIDIIGLVEFLKGSGESDPSKLIEILKRDGVLFPVPSVGKLGVVR